MRGRRWGGGIDPIPEAEMLADAVRTLLFARAPSTLRKDRLLKALAEALSSYDLAKSKVTLA
jgi:hypothetical protein